MPQIITGLEGQQGWERMAVMKRGSWGSPTSLFVKKSLWPKFSRLAALFTSLLFNFLFILTGPTLNMAELGRLIIGPAIYCGQSINWMNNRNLGMLVAMPCKMSFVF